MKIHGKKFKAALSAIAILLATVLVAFTSFAVLEENASGFKNALALAEAAQTLEEKEFHLSIATEFWQLYVADGGSPEDADIKAAYERYAALKADTEAKVELCLKFTEYVEKAIDAEDYPTMKENLNEAGKLIDLVDETYSGVSVAKSEYLSLYFSLAEPENICNMYIEAARAAAEGTTYASVSSEYNNAKRLELMIEIDDYPGLDTARDDLERAQAFMAERQTEASPFIIAVREINSAPSIHDGILKAYSLFEGIDATTDGVAAALAQLEQIKNDYNKQAEEANGALTEANGLIFSLIF